MTDSDRKEFARWVESLPPGASTRVTRMDAAARRDIDVTSPRIQDAPGDTPNALHYASKASVDDLTGRVAALEALIAAAGLVRGDALEAVYARHMPAGAAREVVAHERRLAEFAAQRAAQRAPALAGGRSDALNAYLEAIGGDAPLADHGATAAARAARARETERLAAAQFAVPLPSSRLKDGP